MGAVKPQPTFKQILELYYRGLNDKEMAEELGVSRYIISISRRSLKLPTQRTKRIAELNARITELHSRGLNDHEISRELGINSSTTNQHRRILKLPVNYDAKKFDEEKFLPLYKQGLNDRKIAKELGMSSKCIHNNRKRLGLKANWKRKKFDEERFLPLYRQGLSDCKIAKELGLSPSCVNKNRRKLGLKGNGVRWSDMCLERKQNMMEICWRLYKEGYSFEEIYLRTKLCDFYLPNLTTTGILRSCTVHPGCKDCPHFQPNKDWSVWKEDANVARYYVGLKLMELCRKNSSCSYKPMLPEWEEQPTETTQEPTIQAV